MSDADCTPGREPRSVAASQDHFYCKNIPNMYLNEHKKRGLMHRDGVSL